MKIGIIVDALKEGQVSYSVYVSNLVRELTILDRENEYYLIHFSTTGVYQPFKEVLIPLPPLRPFKKQLWRYVLLPSSLKRLRLDVIHDPCGIGPLSLVDTTTKKVVTIHSLKSMLYHKYGLNPKSDLLGILAYKFFGDRTLRKVDKAIVISEYLKQELISCLKVSEEKIRVIYNGVSEMFRPLTQEEVLIFKKKYGFDEPYILYVGRLDHRKNVSALIKAYYRLNKRNKIRHKLVLVGPKGIGYETMLKIVKKLDLQKNVTFLGYMPHGDLPAIYSMADLFVFPSVYEPFGLPPLEAMACGVPVIASHTGAIPEVVGDAGIFFNPYCVNELSRVMQEVLMNGGLKQNLIKKGLQRVKMFSWKKTAEETLKVYKSIY